VEQNRYRKWKGHTNDLTRLTPEAQAKIRGVIVNYDSILSSEYKAKKALLEIHREHADSEYKAYMDAKQASIEVISFLPELPSAHGLG
jgi:hypothetical protein